MRRYKKLFFGVLLLTLARAGACDEPTAPRFQAVELGRLDAPEAGQGVAVDADHVYAVVNRVIARYDKASGARRGEWHGERNGPIVHLNSCYAAQGELWCAHSNFPSVPMASSVERFDARTLTHLGSTSLGLTNGSLTWFDRRDGSWWAGFAHYDGDGGLPGKDHSWSNIVRYDEEWRAIESFLLPGSVLERMAPHSASGGAFGPDGLLYLTGHDRPEMYVLALPEMGSTLVHVATIDIDVEGQAFAWDRSRPDERIVYGISRANRQIRWFRVPEAP